MHTEGTPFVISIPGKHLATLMLDTNLSKEELDYVHDVLVMHLQFVAEEAREEGEGEGEGEGKGDGT